MIDVFNFSFPTLLKQKPWVVFLKTINQPPLTPKKDNVFVSLSQPVTQAAVYLSLLFPPSGLMGAAPSPRGRALRL